MYRSFYHLNKKPFHITPDPEFLFLSPSHGEAFAAIIYGIEHRKGFLAITGEVGVGKTTILRAYLEKTGHEQHRIIYVFNAAVSYSGLLRLILGEFGVVVAEDDTFAMVNRLHHLLIEEYKNNRNVVLIIDEAQNMPVETLEHLRMLSNLETSEDKLLQIVLVGQPELERILDLHELRQLRQRIAVRCRINALTEAESHAYIQHRLAKASAHGEVIFAPGSLQPIIREAGGIPRIINILCDNALLTGFGYQRKPISKKIVQEVVSEYGKPKRRRPRTWWLAPFAVAALVVFVLFTGFPLPQPDSTSPIKSEERILAAPPVKEGNIASQIPLNPPSGNGEFGEQPISAVSPISPTQPAPDAAPTQEQSPMPAPSHAAPVAWIANRMVDLTPPSPLTPNPLSLTPHPSPLTSAGTEALTKTVMEGDCISHLVRAIYGHVDNKLIQTVKDYNPHIRDINMIKTGDIITFPTTDRMKAHPD